MAEQVQFHDESLMPLIMGSPYRVPYYAYPNWGLTYTGEETALAAYKAEWASGNLEQMALVEEASKKAALNGFPQLLRNYAADTVGRIARRPSFPKGDITILDVGSGPGLSTEQIDIRIPKELRPRVVYILLDPSRESLNDAERVMTRRGARYRVLEGTDSEALPKLRDESVDFLTAVASVHHHSEIPFAEHFRVLKPGGIAIYADWHQDIWLHPASVLTFLEAFDETEWPNREEGLRHWIEVYPQSLETPTLSDDPRDIRARDEITRFWKAYARIVRERDVTNGLWPLEGHRPSYAEELRDAGFMIEEPWDQKSAYLSYNPYRIIDSTSLLQLTVAQKPNIL